MEGEKGKEEERSRFKRICVFCGSQPGKKASYQEAAVELGNELVKSGIDLVYGGGSIGLMGFLSHAVHDGGRHVLGLFPFGQGDHKFFAAERGGYGTLEELLEVITWAQLGIHKKPVGLLNVEGFYDSLLLFIDMAVAEGFISEAARHIIISASSAKELVGKLEDYTPRYEVNLVWDTDDDQPLKLIL